MHALRERGLIEPLDVVVLKRRVPVLGICLGMQLLALRSEEGLAPGLGYIDAQVQRITVPQGSGHKVPHTGWLRVAGYRRRPLLALLAVAVALFCVVLGIWNLMWPEVGET